MAKAKPKTAGNGKSKKGKGHGLKALLNDERTPKVLGLFMVLLALFLLVAFGSHLFTWKADQSEFTVINRPWGVLFDNSIQADNALGRLGAIISHQFFYSWFGISSFLFVAVLFTSGFNLIFHKPVFPIARILRHTFFVLLWLPPLLSFLLYDFAFPYGGGYGRAVADWGTGLMGTIGTGLVLFFAMLTYLVLVFNMEFGIPLARMFSRKKPEAVLTDASGDGGTVLPGDIFEREDLEYGKEEALDIQRNDKQGKEADEEEMEISVLKEEPVPEGGPAFDIEEAPAEEVREGRGITMENFDPTLDLPNYKYPTLDLLEDYGSGQVSIDKDELEKNKDQIVATLQNYNISISKIKATVGPTVTLYEIVPAPGVRISKIKNLEDDIALSLAALGIRIIAPIPGKGTIGIEVPNRKKEIVSMRTLLSSEKFVTSDMELPIAIGKNISGENYIADLAKMPHLLMAGATGQGKSVGINTILMSLLYKKHPSQLKLVMIDPKKVELSLYRYIENHFLAKLPGDDEPIITDTKKVVYTLNALCIEMDERYDLLKNAGVRNIKEYNEKFVARRLNPEKGHRFLPFIVLVIDEFADLMMTAGKEVETPIARLAQLARAVGIHLVIATQRPSVNIITGVIKANFPARIAFKVASRVDSRTILDTGGADQLIGRGDMLLSVGGHLIRLQCAFVDTHEVEKVVDHISKQRGFPEPFLLPEVATDEDQMLGDLDPGDRDEMFEDAARLVVQTQQGSTSMIQRRMKLGYNRAGRIMDQLEQAGIVGPSEGSKPREVLFKTDYDLEQYLKGRE